MNKLCTQFLISQVNPDAETIEKELERAFFLCGAIQESNFGFLQKVQWTRSARTGKTFTKFYQKNFYCSKSFYQFNFLQIAEFTLPLNAAL